jgi:hypothetical protein
MYRTSGSSNEFSHEVNIQFHLTNPYYIIKFFVVEDNDALSKGSEAPEPFSLVYWSMSKLY